mmetsp:Transcript_22811/g.57888  ORF Transcript_22811/g.57888 Transcript_22811/m.57888 type:complete len:252 (+) Transcript_22811:524-1279(+)
MPWRCPRWNPQTCLCRPVAPRDWSASTCSGRVSIRPRKRSWPPPVSLASSMRTCTRRRARSARRFFEASAPPRSCGCPSTERGCGATTRGSSSVSDSRSSSSSCAAPSGPPRSLTPAPTSLRTPRARCSRSSAQWPRLHSLTQRPRPRRTQRSSQTRHGRVCSSSSYASIGCCTARPNSHACSLASARVSLRCVTRPVLPRMTTRTTPTPTRRRRQGAAPIRARPAARVRCARLVRGCHTRTTRAHRSSVR